MESLGRGERVAADLTPELGRGLTEDRQTEARSAGRASEGTEEGAKVGARGVLAPSTAAVKEPFLPQPGPPGGDVQQGRDVVSGDAGAGWDEDGSPALEGPACDDVASVADTVVAHQARHGVETAASVGALVGADCQRVDVEVSDNLDDFLLGPELEPADELSDQISVGLQILLRLRPPLLSVVHQHGQRAADLLAGLHQNQAPDHLHQGVVELQVLPVLRAQPVVVSGEDGALQAVGGVAPALSMSATQRVAAAPTDLLLLLPHLVQTLQTEAGSGGMLGSPAQSLLLQHLLPGLDVPAGHQIAPVLGAGLDTPGQAVGSCNMEREERREERLALHSPWPGL